MANHHHQQHEKRIDHFSHKYPLTLIEIEEDEKESKSEYNNRSSLRCYGCTEKIRSGVLFYQCEEDCPSFCLHHACAHLPTTIRRWHSFNVCDGDLQLTKRPNKDSEYCTVCYKGWYRFEYVCSDCGLGVDMRCATRGPNEAKHSFHQHPVEPYYYRGGKVDGDDLQLVCSVCGIIIEPLDGGRYMCYRCNYCNFTVHPYCTDIPMLFESPCHYPQHKFFLDFDYPGSKICKICQEEIDRTTQWAYQCVQGCGDYYIHAGHDGCLTGTIRKGDLQHFDHVHPLALVEEAAAEDLHTLDGTRSSDDHSCISQQYCHCSKQNISCMPYYTCLHCKISHDHPLFLSLTKGPFSCHACDRDHEGSSYQCSSCKFWVHEQCALLPAVNDNSSHGHPHELHLFHNIPEKYSTVVVYCRICTKTLKHHRWAYHCNQCRYFIHVHDCSNPHREGGVTIDASDVVDLPLDGEPILEEKLTHGGSVWFAVKCFTRENILRVKYFV